MKKIEIGEYVRTNNKGIKRIDRIDNNKTVNKYLYFTGIEDFEGKEYGIIKTTEIVKHRKKLIDLIEDKDIVEIELSEEFVEKKDKKKLIQIGDIYTKETLQKDIDNGIITRILTILSYNQYMANCYKVGGEDEC